MQDCMKKFKILYIYHVSQIGGGSFTLLNIIKELDKSKFQPYVALRDEGPLSEALTKMGVEVHFVSRIRAVPYNKSIWSKSSLKNFINIILSMKEYKRVLEEVKPDIVHVNSMMLYPYLISAHYGGIKTIIHIREHWPRGEHVLQRKIANQVIRKYTNSIFAINAHSASMLDGISKKTHIVYDWIDMDSRLENISLEKIVNEEVGDKKIFLFTGGIQPIKGIHQVLKAFSENILDNNARLLILGVDSVGSAPKYLKDAMRMDSRIKTMPSTYNITHLLQQVYCVISYFTIPHANLALAESIITKTPVLAAKTPESIEYSCEGKYAQLFGFNNYEDFCKHLRRHGEWVEQLRENLNEGSDIIKRMFDSKRNSSIINNVYTNTLSQN